MKDNDIVLSRMDSDLFIPDTGDTPVTDDHFENKSPLYSLQTYLRSSKIVATLVKESPFLTLEGIVQEMEDNPPPKNFVENLKRFRSHGTLPLAIYQDGEDIDIYFGIQAEKREQQIINKTELEKNPEQFLEKRKFSYNSSDPEAISAEIRENVSESMLFKHMKEKNSKLQFKYVLLPVKEFDILENCLSDKRTRDNFLGRINDEDTGRETMKKLFSKTIEIGGTDLHVEPVSSKKARARYRIDGWLVEEMLPARGVVPIVSRSEEH